MTTRPFAPSWQNTYLRDVHRADRQSPAERRAVGEFQHLMPVWGLSAAEGGLLASGYAGGYMLAVPVLTTLTDRIDARIVLLCGSVASGLATVAFGLLPRGFGRPYSSGRWRALASPAHTCPA